MLASKAVSMAGFKLLRLWALTPTDNTYMWTNNYWMYMTLRKCKNNSQ